jgi:predicted Zn-dependent protease
VAALIVGAWFAWAVVQTSNLNHASAILSAAGPAKPSALRDAASALSTAGALNPDRLVDLERAKLAVARGQRAGAVRIIEQVTSSEPDYADAWLALFSTSRNVVTQRHALQEIARLLPPVGRH